MHASVATGPRVRPDHGCWLLEGLDSRQQLPASAGPLVQRRRLRRGCHRDVEGRAKRHATYDAHHGRLVDTDELGQVGVVGVPPPGLRPDESRAVKRLHTCPKTV